MGKWEMVKLGEVSIIQGGYAFKSAQFTKNGIPIIRIGNLNGDTVDLDYNICYPLEFWIANDTYRIKMGDILVAMSGATVGKIGRYTYNQPALLNQRVGLIRIYENQVFPNYVYHYVKSSLFLKQIQQLSFGCAQPNISAKNIESISIPLPPLETQKQIAKTLDTVSELLAMRKQQLAEMDNLIKSIFYDMVGDPVTNEKGWKKALLGELLDDIRYGTSVPPVFSDEGYCFIRATNIKFGRIIDNDIKYISKEEADKISKCRLRDGELIIVRSGVNTGDTCVITGKYVGQYAGYDLIITPNQKVINSTYLNELINTNYVEYIIKPLTRRAAQPHLNAEQIKKLPIILPSLKLQTKFAEIVAKIEEQKALVQKAVDETQYLFDSLMSEYFEKE